MVLLLVSALSIVATVFTSSTISYILPTAECDLHLSLMYKGLLNGIAYAGKYLNFTIAIAMIFVIILKV